MIAVGTPLTERPRTDPYVRLSRIRLPPRVCDGETLFDACRMRASACHALHRFCARCARLWHAFPSVPALRSTGSAADRSALFARFPATTTGPDFSRPCIIGFGSSPSRCGPGQPYGLWSGVRPPRFRRDPFARDGVFDHGRASTPRIAAPHILPWATVTASASTDFGFSRLNSPPHAIAVYASRRSSPSAPQHSLPSARYGLLGPDFHRLNRASFAWRTTVTETPAEAGRGRHSVGQARSAAGGSARGGGVR